MVGRPLRWEFDLRHTSMLETHSPLPRVPTHHSTALGLWDTDFLAPKHNSGLGDIPPWPLVPRGRCGAWTHRKMETVSAPTPSKYQCLSI